MYYVRRKLKKVKKTRLISISPFTVITVGVLIFLGYGFSLMSYAVILIMHEYAHAIVAERLGYELKSIKIMPYGIAINGDFETVTPSDEIKIAIAAPLVNIIFWLIIAGTWWLFPITYSATKFMGEASLFTAIINLIPIYPLDGGRVLRGIAMLKCKPKTAQLIVRITSIVFGACIVGISLFLIICGANYTYATLSVFLVVSLMLPGKGSSYTQIYSIMNRSKRVKRGLEVKEILCHKDVTIIELYKMLRSNYYTKFIIVDDDLQELYLIEETELKKNIIKFNHNEKAIFLAKSDGM